MTAAGTLLLSSAVACIVVGEVLYVRGGCGTAHPLLPAGMGLLAVAFAGIHDWPWVAMCATFAAAATWDWWRRGGRRKRAPGLAGYKARAALARLGRRARQAGRRRPALRPALGGTR